MKIKLDIIKGDRGREIYSNIFRNFLTNNHIKHWSREIDLGAVFAERFNRTKKDLLERPVFEKRGANWIDVLRE